MDWSVRASQVSCLNSKWELAQRMSGHAKAPEQALKSIFNGAMLGIEEATNTTFEASTKERIWNAVSNEKLEMLKEHFMLDFCNKILGGFNEKQAGEMLEEHKKTGRVKNIIYSGQIQTAYYFNQELIIKDIAEKASSMADAWVPEIIEAVKKEGVQLP